MERYGCLQTHMISSMEDGDYVLAEEAEERIAALVEERDALQLRLGEWEAAHTLSEVGEMKREFREQIEALADAHAALKNEVLRWEGAQAIAAGRADRMQRERDDAFKSERRLEAQVAELEAEVARLRALLEKENDQTSKKSS